MTSLAGKRLLLIVPGGIAAFKIARADPPAARARLRRQLRADRAGAQFVTPLSLQALSENQRSTPTCSR